MSATAVVGEPTGGVVVVSVEARNIGRQDVQVIGWGWRISDRAGKDGTLVFSQPYYLSSACPVTVVAGHREGWFVSAEPFNRVLANRESVNLVPYVSLGTGKDVCGKALTLKLPLTTF